MKLQMDIIEMSSALSRRIFINWVRAVDFECANVFKLPKDPNKLASRTRLNYSHNFCFSKDDLIFINYPMRFIGGLSGSIFGSDFQKLMRFSKINWRIFPYRFWFDKFLRNHGNLRCRRGQLTCRTYSCAYVPNQEILGALGNVVLGWKYVSLKDDFLGEFIGSACCVTTQTELILSR